jgi:alpha-L-fucosidase
LSRLSQNSRQVQCLDLKIILQQALISSSAMKYLFLCLIGFVALFLISCKEGMKEPENRISFTDYKPALFRSELLEEWENLQYGMSICFGMSTFTLDEYDKGDTPSLTYAPTELDVRQWISTAKKAGMKYVILTAKHVAGHCLWDSEGYDYDVATSSNKTDVIAEFMAACRAENIKPGLYYCILDRHNEENKEISTERPISNEYFGLIKHHLTELHTRYPDIYEQWIDIPTKLTNKQRWKIYNLIKKLNPKCFVLMNMGYTNAVDVPDESWPTDLVNCERNMPPASGHNPFKSINGETYYLPAEVIDTIGNHWYWAPNDPPKPMELLYQYYLTCVKRRANFLLNVPIDKTGRIPSEYVDTLMKLKQTIDNPSLVAITEIPVSFKCMASCSNIRENNFGEYSPFRALDGDIGTRWATDDDQREYWLVVDLGCYCEFNRVQIKEFGNNIIKFLLEYKQNDEWKPFMKGSTIGEQLTQKFEPIVARYVRLNIQETSKGPSINEFQLFAPIEI